MHGIRRSGLLAALLASAARFCVGQCLPYDPASVTLDGVMIGHEGLRTWWGVRLERAICVIEDPSNPYAVAHRGIAEVQLILSDEVDFDRYRSLLNRRVAVFGKLTPRFTGYHETDVLIIVERITLPDGKTPPTLAPVARPLLNLAAYFASVTVVPGPTGRVSKVAWDIDPKSPLAESDRYTEHLFNGPKDLMWIKCRDGYVITTPISSTNSRIVQMNPNDRTNPYWGVLVSERELSNITVRCVKSNP